MSFTKKKPLQDMASKGLPRKLVYQPGSAKGPKRKGVLLANIDSTNETELPFPVFTTTTPGRRKDKRAHYAQPSSAYESKDKSPAPEEPQTLCLPLSEVSVEVLVDGTTAHTKLTQSYRNTSDQIIPEAHYTFPLYDGAVVTSFRYDIGGHILLGKVKPKEEAKELFKEASKKKKAAALLEEHTPEIFETTIGSVPAETTVKVEITYVNELRVSVLDGTSEGLDVVIPTSIAPRYGTPYGNQRAPDTAERGSLDIIIKVNNPGTVQGLMSPTHEYEVEIIEHVTAKEVEVHDFNELSGEVNLEQMHAIYKSRTPTMHADFVLHIEMRPSHPLRSRAILSPPNREGQSALMVNIKPTEIFQSSHQAHDFEGEIIFVLDRSGSMDTEDGGRRYRKNRKSRIDTLRDAMPISLTSLPSGCAFNIVSFGTVSQFLWDKSQQYTDETRAYAMEYLKTVDADMGGTELLFALQEAVESRLKERRNTQIVIITDGEVDPEGIIDFVLKTRRELQDQIRFFALGIGDHVSHRLIEGIGEFGGGYGEVIDTRANIRWENSLSRMLRSGVTPDSWTLDIDLGPAFKRRTLTDYTLGAGQQDRVAPYIQAPCPIPALHPFMYRSIFFLLDTGSKPPPTQVILKPTNAGIRSGTQHTLDVEPTWTNKTAIHQLAAKHILISLQLEVEQDASISQLSLTGRTNAEKLGELYSVTSKWTSFVAVDQEDKDFNEIVESRTEMVPVDVEALRKHLAEQLDALDTESSEDESESQGMAAGIGIGNDVHLMDSEDAHNCGGHHRHRHNSRSASPKRRARAPLFTCNDDPFAIRRGRSSTTGRSVKEYFSLVPATSSPRLRARPARNDWADSGESEDDIGPPSPEQRRATSRSNSRSSSPDLPFKASEREEREQAIETRRQMEEYKRKLDEGRRALEEEHREPALERWERDREREYMKSKLEERQKRIIDLEYERQGDQAVSPARNTWADEVIIEGYDGDSDDVASANSGRETSQRVEWNSDEETDEDEDRICCEINSESESEGGEDDSSNSWRRFVGLQKFSGLFELPRSWRETIHMHFCPETRTVLDTALAQHTTTQSISDKVRDSVADTLMTIVFFEVHVARDKDLWIMMMDKAEYAVRQALRISEGAEDTFIVLKRIVEGASKHQHFLAAGYSCEAVSLGFFPPSNTADACPSCKVGSKVDVATRRTHTNTVVLFRCPFEECEMSETDWADWDELWEHQVEEGHVVCPKEERLEESTEDHSKALTD